MYVHIKCEWQNANAICLLHRLIRAEEKNQVCVCVCVCVRVYVMRVCVCVCSAFVDFIFRSGLLPIMRSIISYTYVRLSSSFAQCRTVDWQETTDEKDEVYCTAWYKIIRDTWKSFLHFLSFFITSCSCICLFNLISLFYYRNSTKEQNLSNHYKLY